MKVYYDERPKIFEPIGDGKWRYHYDIKKEITEQEDEKIHTQWVCEEVICTNNSSNDVLEAVIAGRWRPSAEAKIINEYNSIGLGLYQKKEADAIKKRYVAFLNERIRLKTQVEKDFLEHKAK